MKLNIGSNNKKIEGYINVDALDLPNVDYQCDLTEIPWNFLDLIKIRNIDIKWSNSNENRTMNIKEIEYIPKNDSVEEILMVEVLEHISFRKTDAVLKECCRVLQPGGKLIIQVPDCGKMMEAYCFNKISPEVPHKPKNDEEVFNVMLEKGKVVHPNRWLFAFTGAQKHPYDAHLNIFTKERMEEYLDNAGFSEINFLEDPLGWKIKVVATK